MRCFVQLQAQVQKAQGDYQLATMERDTAILALRNAAAARDQLKAINTFGVGVELKSYDQILVGQQVYATSMRTLDDLVRLYVEMGRALEYENVPFDETGKNLVRDELGTNLDFNLTNFRDMRVNLTRAIGRVVPAISPRRRSRPTIVIACATSG